MPPPAASSQEHDDGHPQVALPSAGMPTWVLLLIAGAFGLAVVLVLNGQRPLRAQVSTGRTFTPAPVPPLPAGLVRDPDYAVAIGQQRADWNADAPFGESVTPFDGAFAQPSRATAPSSAFDAPPERIAAAGSEAPGGMRFPSQPMPGAPSAGGGGGRAVATGGSALVYDAAPGAPGGFGDDKAASADGAAAVRASLIRNRPAIVPQGEVLAATLETPVSSTRPGPIRAVVSRDVRSFDGSRILIPRGSRLIGDYRAEPGVGRRRILATWTRLIRPDGVAIRIDSPAADPSGGTGIPGKVDTHFLARFANAALQSALQIGVNLASRAGDGSVIIANTPQVSSAMGGNIIPGADEPPTVNARAGASIAVFVARDLDFSGVPAVR